MRVLLSLVLLVLSLGPARAADASDLLKNLLDKPLPAPTASATSSAAGKFKPSGKRLALEGFVSRLSQKPEERKTYSNAILAVVQPIEAEFKKVGQDNDAAVAMALYLVTSYQMVSGKDVSDAASDALVKQLQRLWGAPELAKLSDLEKQQSYETFLYNVALDQLLLQVAAENQKQGVRDAAGRKLEALLGIQVSQMQFSSAGLALAGSAGKAPSAPAAAASSALSFQKPKVWEDLGVQDGARRYRWAFSESEGFLRPPDGTTSPQMIPNTLEVTVLPAVSRKGTLQAQAADLWKQLTKGNLDKAGAVAPVLVARLPVGMNAAYVRGTLETRPNPLGGTFSGTTVIYSLLYLFEHDGMATPVFFLATKADSGYPLSLNEVRPSVLEFLLSAKPRGVVKAAELFDPKDFLGKWVNSSSFYQTYSNLYTGAYAGYTNNAFVFRYTLRPGGQMDYFSQAIRVASGSSAVQTENEKANWTLSGDLLTVTVPAKNRVLRFKVYGVSRDAQNRPMLLLTSLDGQNANGVALDSLPEEAWAVDTQQ